jgi:hypothetical protein
MNIQEKQRLYLKTIFDHFHETAEWPTYRDVDGKLIDIDPDLDIQEISASLPSGFANIFRSDNDLDIQAILSIDAIRVCENSEGDLADFITTVRFFVDTFNKLKENNPTVNGRDLKNHLNISDDAIKRVGKMIIGENMLYGTFQSPTDVRGTWVCSLKRDIRRFRGVISIEDYLERRDKERITARQQETSQLASLLGHMYRQPNTEDIQAGIQTWIRNLTEPNQQTGAKLEVALLNALARLGVPTLFGGDIQCGGPATPRYDLVALNIGAPMQSPTAVLISCKSTGRQPDRIEIALLSDESRRVKALLPDWQVFGALVNLGEPTADEFNYRDDVRIWKQPHLQALLHAKELRYVSLFLWTPPWQWNRDRELMWQHMYRANH